MKGNDEVITMQHDDIRAHLHRLYAKKGRDPRHVHVSLVAGWEREHILGVALKAHDDEWNVTASCHLWDDNPESLARGLYDDLLQAGAR